jgi:endonuclease/exonuclease/phosphatase family metal-dependent hydrolase
MKSLKLLLFLVFVLIFDSLTLAQTTLAQPYFKQLQQLKIITINLHCFEDNWKFRLSHILDGIVRISPDVIAFQEVCENPKTQESQIVFIKSYLSQRGFPIKAADVQFTHYAWDKYTENIMLISKQAPSRIDKGFLPQSLLQRGFLSFEINNQWFICTHLEYRTDLAHFRVAQINFLTSRYSQFPHIIFGDFNSAPIDSEQAIFKNKQYFGYFPGATLIGDDSNLHNYIDGFWLSPGFYKQLKNVNGELLFKEKVQGHYLSDHFGVLINLGLQNRKRL